MPWKIALRNWKEDWLLSVSRLSVQVWEVPQSHGIVVVAKSAVPPLFVGPVFHPPLLWNPRIETSLRRQEGEKIRKRTRLQRLTRQRDPIEVFLEPWREGENPKAKLPSAEPHTFVTEGDGQRNSSALCLNSFILESII